MARATGLMGPNMGNRFAKMERLRLSDVAAATTTDAAEIIVGDGAPSGGYGMPSGATGAYFRKDASSVATALYVTVNGGTAWTAVVPTATISDPGTGVAIPVTASGTVAMTVGGAETNTLAIPSYVGQTLSIYVYELTAGSRVVTASQAINQAGNTIMTFAAARDFIKLEAISTVAGLRWQVVSNDGAALS